MELLPIDDEEIARHLERHLEGSEIIGSKFLSSDIYENVLTVVSQRLSELFAGGEREKNIFNISFEEHVGTDALLDVSDSNGIVNVKRNPGDITEIQVIVVPDEELPLTNEVTVIAGPSYDKRFWGLYTLFPGKAAEPFPTKDDSTKRAQELDAYWHNHGFYATQSEFDAAQASSAPKIADGVSEYGAKPKKGEAKDVKPSGLTKQ